ncbi:major facilitator superfamily domain-containing protein [Xylariales sp. PMI_506]|nr:major facilitator superfamily domain-containing protein [Xylariales sp. PMI_506]
MGAIDTKPPLVAPEATLPSSEEDRKYVHSRWRYATILVAAFMINFTAGGLLFGFGVYQALYESMATEPATPFTNASSAEIDMIGSLSTCLMAICAPLAVAWAKHFDPPRVVCAGAVVTGLSCVLASFGTALWHFELAQGFLLGIGICFSYIPAMTVAPTWFGRHRGLAMGVVSAGSGIGGLVWAPAVTACVNGLGFRNTLRITGTVAAVLMLASGLVIRWEPSMAAVPAAPAAAQEQHNDGVSRYRIPGWLRIPLPGWKVVTQRRFLAPALSGAFQTAAYYTPVFFVVSYAETLGYSDSDGANLTAICNACNAIGKISVGFIADRIGRLNAFFLTTLISAVATAGLWISSISVGEDDEAMGRSLFIGFIVLYGLFASAFVSLFTPALVEIFGVQELPRLAGIMYMVQGMAAMVGTPVAGALLRSHGIENSPNNYLSMAILVSVLLASGTVTAVWARMELMIDRAGGKWHWTWKI